MSGHLHRAGVLIIDSRNFDYFLERLMTFLRHLGRFDVITKCVHVFSTLLRSFWWLNERSTSIIKRDIGRQSSRKIIYFEIKFVAIA